MGSIVGAQFAMDLRIDGIDTAVVLEEEEEEEGVWKGISTNTVVSRAAVLVEMSALPLVIVVVVLALVSIGSFFL